MNSICYIAEEDYHVVFRLMLLSFLNVVFLTPGFVSAVGVQWTWASIGSADVVCIPCSALVRWSCVGI